MITPKDIHDKEFKRSLRGYDLDEVDKFLDLIIKDMEELQKENANLREECDRNIKKVDHYIEMETSLNRSLLLADRTAENLKQEAMLEKDKILEEARIKAIEIIDKAKEDAKGFNTVNLELIEYSDRFNQNLINLFENQINMLKEFGGIEDNLNFKNEMTERVRREKEELGAEIIEDNSVEENVDNNLLDEEEEEFKNKVFKFLDK